MSVSESSFPSYDLFDIATLVLKMIFVFKLMSQKKTEKGAINVKLNNSGPALGFQ